MSSHLLIILFVLSFFLVSFLLLNFKYFSFIFVCLIWVMFFIFSHKRFGENTLYFKSIAMYLSLTSVTYSLWYRNEINDNYIAPILFMINILFILPMCLFDNNNKFSIDFIKTLLLGYLLATFKLENFKLYKGKFVNLDKRWLITHLLILIFIYQDNGCMGYYKNYTIKPIVWIALYPLLFPLDEFLIHRVISLCIMSILWWKDPKWYF